MITASGTSRFGSLKGTEVLDLRGKAGVVTGAANGIGETIAVLLSSVGAKVGIIDTSTNGAEVASKITNSGGTARFVPGSVADESQMELAIDQIADEFGGIDFLVNNAGISGKTRFEDLGADEWRRILEVNLTGAFVCAKLALKYLKERDSANIVMLSSGSAITGTGGSVAYAASKGGINSMVRALARELARYNIRVNAVAPRTVRGRMLESVHSRSDIEQMEKGVPLQRLGTEIEIANVVLFLLSDLSSYITGETILVDGGRTFCGKD